MKRSLINSIILITGMVFIAFSLTDCKKTENPIKFPLGTFPDTVQNLGGINSAYDDYNIGLYELYGNAPIVFSSNRGSTGGQFDLEQGLVSFSFDQVSGIFSFQSEMITDQFLSNMISKAETPGNDFGPYRMFSLADGYEYMILSSETEAGDLDLYYLKNPPMYDDILPGIEGPYPVKLLNTDSDDAYICFDNNLDSAYFTSNRGGDFDIYLLPKPEEQSVHSWFDQDFEAATTVDNINSPSDDKCPMVFRTVMVFASDRPGGLGGFDLYYSLFENGNWSAPVNLGPKINSSADEYRPVLGHHPDFTNLFMMFSSNRSGGKGGFDLYFTGIEFPEK
jgi:hypothetical protein